MKGSTDNYHTLVPDIYFDPYFEQDAVKILPGEYYVTARDMILVTVLGSCVCACIRDPQTGIGGMCHFMLPEQYLDDSLIASSMRYGSHAMETLINQLIKNGAQREHLQAKVFGACNALASPGGHKMGEHNSRFVVAYLEKESIPVLARDLLDVYPRKVYFFTRTGLVRVKKLKKLNNTTIMDREADYYSRLTDADMSGDVELFR
ncbi:chemoreceptor glutamine deamidase CheD [Nitrincola iocasae]|uniref:Probable chemoreceptor glutamine deamidase CheD n=1 Tax=Nitrincola iocasae TaxID=2614693 RepID=A0A5J6LBR5_9GAMM|nr:chemoreceptor glutamine deamidase CheD [Nitrincola iocasae]QEW06124.1 chemoreceptor glutamine deamidase CheD [Nitrincola iocasae]